VPKVLSFYILSMTAGTMPQAENTYDDPLEQGKGDDNVRLQANHYATKLAMAGSLVLAPFDTTRRNLKILDSGTSDGRSSHRDLSCAKRPDQ
jgi:hypothetical protein